MNRIQKKPNKKNMSLEGQIGKYKEMILGGERCIVSEYQIQIGKGQHEHSHDLNSGSILILIQYWVADPIRISICDLK